MCRSTFLAIALLGPLCGCAHERHLPTDSEAKVDTDMYIQQSVERLRAQTAEHVSGWHLGDHIEWGPDLENNRVVFVFPDGSVAEAADAQIVGSYDPASKTFTWGWTHLTAGEEFTQPAHLAKQFGIKNKLQKYTESFVSCTEDDAREFLAVAARLAKTKGAYGGTEPATGTILFVTFGDVTVRSP